MFRRSLMVAMLCANLLSACHDEDGNGGTMETMPPTAGALLQKPTLVSSINVGSLLAELSLATHQQLFTLTGVPVCDVNVYHFNYETVGGAGEAGTASAALMVPSGTGSGCSGGRAIVLYAHGTNTDRGFNIADLSNSENAEGLVLAAMFAAQGYIVIAPNYAGYDTSSLTYHPFLNAVQQSTDMIDALTAGRSALPVVVAPQSTDGGKLFITGYSQGGYVAMATQRAMQTAGMTVSATVAMSGPYALSAFVDAVFEGEVDTDAPILSTLLFTSYQKSYGNVYSSSSDLYEAQYAAGIESVLPSTMTRGQLYAAGKLPQNALFSATPPTPAYADMTPATTPHNLASIFALGFGAADLVNNNFRLSYLTDAQTRPDGGFPVRTDGLPPASPALALRQDLKLNDLRDWTPTAPSLLCGGDSDPAVFWLNTQLMQNYWATRTPAPASVAVLDLDAAPSSGDAYAALKSGFAAAKTVIALAAVAQGATDGGASAILGAYHSTLVSPFCVAAAKSFFDAH